MPDRARRTACAVDIDGNLWCGWGMGDPELDGVVVFAPDGVMIGRIALPERCANLCFGGVKRNRLFMAASQSIYALYVNTQGALGRIVLCCVVPASAANPSPVDRECGRALRLTTRCASDIDRSVRWRRQNRSARSNAPKQRNAGADFRPGACSCSLNAYAAL